MLYVTSGGILTFGVYATVVNTMATAASVADGAWRHAVGTGLNTSNLFFTVASGITANSLSAIGYIYLTSSNQVVISAEL